MIDDKAKEIIEQVLARRTGAAGLGSSFEPRFIHDILTEIEGQARAEGVAICAVKQTPPRTASDRVEDFEHTVWCETLHYAAAFAEPWGRCPTCDAPMKASAR
jgi:hypothetical protein